MKTYTPDEARQTLERYCAYQERNYLEVEKKMRAMQLIPELREQILMHLITENYINEERYAKAFAGGKFRINKWGRIRIKQALKQNGISPANIQLGLDEIAESDYLKTLRKMAVKWIKSRHPNLQDIPDDETLFKTFIKENTSFSERQKMLKYLQQRGYELDLIFKYIVP